MMVFCVRCSEYQIRVSALIASGHNYIVCGHLWSECVMYLIPTLFRYRKVLINLSTLGWVIEVLKVK